MTSLPLQIVACFARGYLDGVFLGLEEVYVCEGIPYQRKANMYVNN